MGIRKGMGDGVGFGVGLMPPRGIFQNFEKRI